MKKISILLAFFISITVFGQQFEEKKSDMQPFDGLKVQVGGDFALQFQGLESETQHPTIKMDTLAKNFNLPTANLDIRAQLADGVKMQLRMYLSARHHNETWVKGGFIQIDKLDFIKEGFLSEFMDMTTINIGVDEINYGDAHFRRSDNAEVINNPFVGNYIMDAFTTEAFGEVTLQKNGFLGVVGLSNGKLNQNVYVKNGNHKDNKVSFYGKLGYDKQVSDDLRVRLTGSWYMNHGETTGTSLYGGDRAGSRYYYVMLADNAADADLAANFTTGRFNPGFKQLTAIQFNPFLKYKGLEFFGVYEVATDNDTDKGKYTQLGAELLYRFGGKENFYIGGRYNQVSGFKNETAENSDLEQKIDRVNLGFGYFLTKNVLLKAEYVKQNYSGDGFNGTIFQANGDDKSNFGGYMLEAAISF